MSYSYIGASRRGGGSVRILSRVHPVVLLGRSGTGGDASGLLGCDVSLYPV